MTKTRRLKELFTFRYGISPLPRSCGYFSRKFPHQVKRRGGGRKEGGINIQIMLTFLTQEKTEIKGNLLALVPGLITTTIEFKILSRMF